jgi:putative AlgH/UPF0301 family transcriptional regulator
MNIDFNDIKCYLDKELIIDFNNKSFSYNQAYNITKNENDKLIAQLAKYKSKDDIFISVGYSAWASWQLEAELKDNAWLVLSSDNDKRLIFDIDPVNRYDEAMRMLGINNIGQLYYDTSIIT